MKSGMFKISKSMNGTGYIARASDSSFDPICDG
jgi:hypothetical protein